MNEIFLCVINETIKFQGETVACKGDVVEVIQLTDDGKAEISFVLNKVTGWVDANTGIIEPLEPFRYINSCECEQ